MVFKPCTKFNRSYWFLLNLLQLLKSSWHDPFFLLTIWLLVFHELMHPSQFIYIFISLTILLLIEFRFELIHHPIQILHLHIMITITAQFPDIFIQHIDIILFRETSWSLIGYVLAHTLIPCFFIFSWQFLFAIFLFLFTFWSHFFSALFPIYYCYFILTQLLYFTLFAFVFVFFFVLLLFLYSTRLLLMRCLLCYGVWWNILFFL